MVEQYPHFLIVLGTGDSTQDNTGSWVENPVTSKFLSKCREETNGKGAEVATAGGVFRKYTSLVFLPSSCPSVKEGEEVLIANDVEGEDTRIRGTVLKFDKGQLHCRLWL